MPKIPEIKFDEITIAEKYAAGYEYERCKNGLWSIHNVIRKISNTAHPRIVECLCNIGVHGAFENGEMTSLVFAGMTKQDYKRGLPAAKYMFALEQYGFIFTDIAAVKKDMSKTKLASKDIIRFTLSYMAIRVNGDSMIPEYKNGDIVLVIQQPSVDIGEVGIFIHNGEGYIKRLEKEGLVSLNPKYKTIRVRELDSFKTVGKVLCVV